jgi:hypothetical protein
VTYTIQSAAYANSEHTAAIIQTLEAGSVAISQRDAPDVWNAMLAKGGVGAYAAPAVPPRKVLKSVIVTRLIAAGKIVQAVQAIQSAPDLFARWTAADKGDVNYNDADTIAFLQAIGADPATILAE